MHGRASGVIIFGETDWYGQRLLELKEKCYMTTIVTQNMLVSRAVDWISSKLADQDKSVSINKLLEEAAIRFNLSPVDADFLQRLCTEGKEDL